MLCEANGFMENGYYYFDGFSEESYGEKFIGGLTTYINEDGTAKYLYRLEEDNISCFSLTLLKWNVGQCSFALPVELYDPEDTERFNYSKLKEGEWYLTGVTGSGSQISFETRSEEGTKINDFLFVSNLSTDDDVIILKDSKGDNNIRIYRDYLKKMKGIIGRIVEEAGKKYFVITDHYGKESWILDGSEEE